jgi:iron complex transport system permease protein
VTGRIAHPLVLGLAAATLALAIVVGPDGVSAPLASDVERRIVMELRLPRVLLGFIGGAALAVAGMAFQALFRNALATPYTVGVSAGASLGAAMYAASGLAASPFAVPAVNLAAFGGALVALGLVFGLARGAGDASGPTLLLGGVAVSFVCSSLILVIQYAGDVTTAFRIGRWLLGGVEAIGFVPVLQLAPVVAAGVAALCAVSRHLDLLAVGDDWAAQRGVAVRAVRQLVFGASSLMVAAVVAMCGPIGFVGLVVPHIGRLTVGPGHRALAPFCVVAGGAFLVACDAIARLALAPVELPVGVVTALVGGPFLLALLRQGHAARRLRA